MRTSRRLFGGSFMKIDEIVKRMESKIDSNCFDFSLHIDCCRIVLSNERRKDLIIKVRFDGCADEFLGSRGGCDCILVFSDKICLVECTSGKFRDSEVGRRSIQIRKCYEFVRSLGYDGLVEIVIYSNHFKGMAMKKFEHELKDVKKKGAIIRFLRCGRDGIT